MKSLLVLVLLSLPSCIGHEPFWWLQAGRAEGFAVGSGGEGPHTFGREDYDSVGLGIGGRFTGPTRFSEIDREIFRGARGGGNVGIVMGGAERINALTAEVATERATAKGLRDQITHLEGDLASQVRGHEEIKRRLGEKTAEVATLNSELAEAKDWGQWIDKWIESLGLIGTIICLLILGWVVVLVARAKFAGKKKK